MTTASTTETDPHRRVELPDAPAIPGLTFRQLDLDADLDALMPLYIECLDADGIDYRPSAEETRHEFEHRAHFDITRDVVVGELSGRLVAIAETQPVVRAGTVVHESACSVRPDVRRRGIGRALLHWVAQRAAEVATEWPGDAPHELETWLDDKEAGALALLASEGFREVRYGFMMVRPLDEPIPAAPLPAGLEIRPVREADHRAIWNADVEAFRDHWEPAERTEEDFDRWFTMPKLDTRLWRVAWAGDQVAGSVWNVVWDEENEQLGVKRGWLEHVSVRRPWRKQGLASALIVDSLRMLRDLGMQEGALGVDSQNPTGALRLYESLGFRRHRRGIGLRRALQATRG